MRSQVVCVNREGRWPLLRYIKCVTGLDSSSSQLSFFADVSGDGMQAEYNWTRPQHGSLQSGVSRAINSLPIPRTDLVMVGIFCRAEDVSRRLVIRRTSAQLAPSGVIVRFVVCLPVGSPPDALLWAEMQRETDMFLMDCVENMDRGKSVHFFKHVRRRFPGFSFYAKADMDSYILYHNLALALAKAPKAKFYGGRSNFGLNSRTIHNMSGSLYVLSSDLVEALEGCGQECEDLTGFEDLRTGIILNLLTGDTLRIGDFGRNHSILYNHWDSVDANVHPWLVLVHPVKNLGFWWNLHVHFAKTITAEAVRQGLTHDFFDGQHSRL